MAILFHGAGTASIVGGTSDATPTLPASMAAGYLSILMLYGRSTHTHTVPAGWTEFVNTGNANACRFRLFYRIYVGGDGDPTITHAAAAGANDTYAARIFVYRSDAGGTLSVSLDTESQGAAAEDIGPITGLNGTTGQMICVAGGRRDDATSIATLTIDSLTWNERWDEGSIVGGDLHVAFQDTLLAGDLSPLSDATLDVTTAGGNSEWAGSMFVINEAVDSFIPRIMVI